MSDTAFLHRFVAIEGNIGAGKTTLCEMIARDFDWRLILEQFTDNPFLPFFYDNPDRYAFPVELFFMTERHKQLQEELAQQDLFQQSIVSDYFFVKTLLFARNNLNPEEYRLFQRLFNVLNNSFSKPDLLVYLHRSVENLLENIEKRGRGMEKNISSEYLGQIQQAYFDFFKTAPQIPIVVIDVESIDFVTFPDHYQQIISIIQKPYEVGVHHITLKQEYG